jgi:hypothetical protein
MIRAYLKPSFRGDRGSGTDRTPRMAETGGLSTEGEVDGERVYGTNLGMPAITP